jgi:hexosaminidase
MTSTDLPPDSPGPASQGPPPPVPTFPILRVVPLPTSYTTGLTPVLISPDLDFIFHQSGRKVSLPSDLARSMKRTTDRLQQTQHQYLSPTRGAEFFLTSASPILTEVRLVLDITAGEEVASIAQCAHAEAEDRPLLEAYSLSVPLKGPAIIKAKSALGLLRGLTTLEQLVYRAPPSIVTDSPSPPSEIVAPCDSLYAPFAPYNISDRPAFGWRGLLLDTSRNWIGLEAIRKVRSPSRNLFRQK